MTDNELYIADRIRLWTWSGFHSPDQVREMIDDILEDDCDVFMLEGLVTGEFAKKREAERNWPETTDCDRLDNVFHALHEEGICALSNAGYTMSDGYSDVAEAVAEAPEGHYHGYCFYHGQDTERAVEGHGVMVAFGDLKDDPIRGVAVGQRVAGALRNAGFAVAWDGTDKSRINLPEIDWKRRNA
ncbi:MAG: hypothetical protein EOO28_17080 [Comamonadaceae bacterium]|nr:MAG: hypothetical protein EOO28_17080 [Comamonadaceae bacterium]